MSRNRNRNQQASDLDELKKALDAGDASQEQVHEQDGLDQLDDDQHQAVEGEQGEQTAEDNVLHTQPVDDGERSDAEQVTLDAQQVKDSPNTLQSIDPPAPIDNTVRGQSAVFNPVDEFAFIPAPTPTTQKDRIVSQIELDLVNYMEAMDPKKPVTQEHGVGWQYSLFQTLDKVLQNPDPEAAKEQWRAVLAFFHQHASAMFNENNMFRFMTGWKGSVNEGNAFRRIVFLAIATANPQTRAKAMQSVVLERVTEGLSPTATANLNNFYG